MRLLWTCLFKAEGMLNSNLSFLSSMLGHRYSLSQTKKSDVCFWDGGTWYQIMPRAHSHSLGVGLLRLPEITPQEAKTTRLLPCSGDLPPVQGQHTGRYGRVPRDWRNGTHRNRRIWRSGIWTQDAAMGLRLGLPEAPSFPSNKDIAFTPLCDRLQKETAGHMIFACVLQPELGHGKVAKDNVHEN